MLFHHIFLLQVGVNSIIFYNSLQVTFTSYSTLEYIMFYIKQSRLVRAIQNLNPLASKQLSTIQVPNMFGTWILTVFH